jgi:type VI secretion system secreted protein VgrG
VGGVHTVIIEQPSDPPATVPPTKITMHDKYIEATTGEATIILQGPDVSIRANGNISLSADGAISIVAKEEVAINGMAVKVVADEGDVTIQGGPMVKINC